MTAATTTYASFPCPDCKKLISYEGRDIHLCVTRLMDGRKVLEVSREYVGHYDGHRVCGKADHHLVEVELDRYVKELQASGLTASVAQLDGGMPEWEADIPSVLEVTDGAPEALDLRDALMREGPGESVNCTMRGCTRPATKIGLSNQPVCAECDAAGMERLYHKIFESDPDLDEPQNDVCWSCGDQLAAPTPGPALCAACQEAGQRWPEIHPALAQHMPAVANPSAPAPAALSPTTTTECAACWTVQPCHFDAELQDYICADRTGCDDRIADLSAIAVPPEALAAAEQSVKRVLSAAVARMQPTAAPSAGIQRDGAGATRPCPDAGLDRPTAPPACPIAVQKLHHLRTTSTPAFRAALVELSPEELATEARIYAEYVALIGGKRMTAEAMLAYFQQQIGPAPVQRDAAVELDAYIGHALTDLVALAAFLGAYSEAEREQLVWRFADWLLQEHGKVVEPAAIRRGWDLLLVGAAANGMATPSGATAGE